MAKEVILTPLALDDFNNVIEYLTNNWSLEVVNAFVERFQKITLLLSENSALYPFFDTSRKLQNIIFSFSQKLNELFLYTPFLIPGKIQESSLIYYGDTISFSYQSE